jgi:hypothetical protein
MVERSHGLQSGELGSSGGKGAPTVPGTSLIPKKRYCGILCRLFVTENRHKPLKQVPSRARQEL